MAAELGARAFTHQNHIWLGTDENASDETLLAHELTHVVQQQRSPSPVLQRQCDPTSQSRPRETSTPASAEPETRGIGAPACIAPDQASNVTPLDQDTGTCELPLSLAVSGSGPSGQTQIERLQLANPIVSATLFSMYIVPADVLFATAAEAAAGTCRAPTAPCTPGDPTCAPPPFTPAQPVAVPATPASNPQDPPQSTQPQSNPPQSNATSTPPQQARFSPGQVVYALDGPLTVVSASADYVVTRQYTKFAVGAGSLTLVRTQAGLVIVDAGMQQQGGQYNAPLADALVESLVQAIGAEPVLRLAITHMHADHTLLAPRIYARIQFGVLQMNALQALMPATNGQNKAQELAQQMMAERQRYVEQQVRQQLASTFGPWDLLIDPTARQQMLDSEVQRQAAQRLAAMPTTSVELAVPAGGNVTPVTVPIGNIALSGGSGPTPQPITQPAVGPGAATVLNPSAGQTTQNMLATGTGPSNTVVDAQSSSYLLVMPSGAQALVVSDVRAADVVQLQSQFEAAMAQLGKPVNFLLVDATHHLQRGFTTGDGVLRASQLGAFTRMLYDLSRAQHENQFVGGAVVVSVLGTPGGAGRNYVDPSLVWILRSSGFEVMPATGGGEMIGSGKNISVLQAELDEGRTTSGVVGGTYPTLSPGDLLIRRADAALAQIDNSDLPTLNRELQAATNDAERTQAQQRIRDKTSERGQINAAKLAYIQAVQTEIGRGPNQAAPAVAPAISSEPAQVQGAALRALIVNYTAPVVGQAPRFTESALVVIGQEQMSSLSPDARALLAARNRVADLAGRLRWSSTPEERTPLVTALNDYRSRLMSAAASAQSPNRETLQNEIARVDFDLTTVTGLSSRQLEEIRQAATLANEASRNVARPAEVASPSELTDSEVANRIVTQNNGYVVAGGSVYHLTVVGHGVTFNLVQLGPAAVPRSSTPPPPQLPPAGGSGQLALLPSRPRGNSAEQPGGPPIVVPGVPHGFAQMPNVINFSGRTIILSNAGEVIPPTPSEPIVNAQPGELIVRGFSTGWFVCDPATGRPIAAAVQGGETWQVVGRGTYTLVVDARGNVQTPGAVTMVVHGENIPAFGRSQVPSPEATSGGPSTSTRVVAGGMGILLVAQQILEPIGRTLQVHRGNIATGRAQLEFWMRFGGRPAMEMRTQNDDATQPVGTPAETAALYGQPIYPRVTSIDTVSLGATLNAIIATYQDFVLWLDMGLNVGALELNPGLRTPTKDVPATGRTYAAIIAGPPGTRTWPRVDLTPILRPIEQRTLASLETQMQGRVSALPTGERANVFALKAGSETSLSRTQGSGLIHPRESILSANFMLGPHPWVHVLERRNGWAYVEAANADAARSAMVSMYTIQKPIGEALEEVKAGGRPIKEQWTNSIGDVDGFVAGPSPNDPRFGGDTRYYRHPTPDTRNIWTVAIGQLDRFWVSESDLQGIDAGALDQYAPQSGAQQQGGGAQP